MKAKKTVSKRVLKDIYRIHSLVGQMYNNELNDRGIERGNIRPVLYKEASDLLQDIINDNPPLPPN
jgi:hypothetical protein